MIVFENIRHGDGEGDEIQDSHEQHKASKSVSVQQLVSVIVRIN